MRRLLALATLATALAAPAAAQAGVTVIGSDLNASAALTESHPRDWAAWPVAHASGGAVAAPFQGEVTAVDFKGTIRKPDNDAAYNGNYPAFNVLVVVLRPQPDGRVQFIVATPDLAYQQMFGVPPETVTNFDIKTMEGAVCVQPGDFVALATSGGFGNRSPQFGGFPDDYYADGYPVQMFGRVPDSSHNLFEQPASGTDDGNGFQQGDFESGNLMTGRELLMRVTLANGADASSSCQTAEERQGPTLQLPEQPFRNKLTPDAKFNLQMSCVSLKACNGTVYIKHKGTAQVGKGTFALAGKATAAVPIQVNANGLRKMKQRKGRMKVTVVARPAGGKRLDAGPFKLVR